MRQLFTIIKGIMNHFCEVGCLVWVLKEISRKSLIWRSEIIQTNWILWSNYILSDTSCERLVMKNDLVENQWIERSKVVLLKFYCHLYAFLLIHVFDLIFMNPEKINNSGFLTIKSRLLSVPHNCLCHVLSIYTYL